MNKQLLREIITIASERSAARFLEQGIRKMLPDASYGLNAWALCYADAAFRSHGDARLLEAILALGDHERSCFDEKKGFVADLGEPDGQWDEWRAIAWLEAMALLGDKVDAERRQAWRRAFLAFGEHFLAGFYDQDTFDGGIPNHGIWNHVFAHRIGQVLGVKELLDAARLGMGRILAGQTPDGCFRELQSVALFQGTPVTGYNLTSAHAINLYCGHSKDPKAAEALEKAWHWYYDYLLPDFSLPPNFDFRQAYAHGHGGARLPAHFMNKPEGAYITRLGLEEMLRTARSDEGKHPSLRGTGWLAFQYPMVEEGVEPREPRWPEFQRMLAEEAGVRRRNGWTAHLSGMTNVGNSNYSLRLFAQERQDHLSLHQERAGLLMGSSGSMITEDLSTFVFYDTGRAHYLTDEAYLKSSPALDTLLLRYGSNVGAASIDTSEAARARIILSLHGERGHHPRRGVGHTQSAMAAKAHLTLRLKAGDTVTAGQRSWLLAGDDETMLRLAFDAGQEVSFGAWALVCVDGPWQLRWPVRAYNPYSLLGPGEQLAVAEVILHAGAGALGSEAEQTAGRPTATFHVIPKAGT